MATCRILSLDGGPDGILTATLLYRLEEARPGFLSQVDVFVGTSIGAVIALMLASSADSVQELGDARALARNLWRLSRRGFDLRAMWGFAALQSGAKLGALMADVFGTRTLGDLKRRVIVPTFVLDNRATTDAARSWQPRLFHNVTPSPATRLAVQDPEVNLVDLAMAALATPVVLPTYRGHVDATLFASNPALAAVALLLDRAGTNRRPAATRPNGLEEVRLLSVGTGRVLRYVPARTEDWGANQWLLNPDQPALLLEVTRDAVGELVEYQCSALLGAHQYLRLNPDVPGLSVRDVAEATSVRYAAAERTDVEPAVAWLARAGWFAPAGDAPRAASTPRRRGGPTAAPPSASPT